MIPKPRDRLLCQAIGTETRAVAIEDGEFVFGHDIIGWMRLDAVPNLAEGSFKNHVDG